MFTKQQTFAPVQTFRHSPGSGFVNRMGLETRASEQNRGRRAHCGFRPGIE
jgi:hypothetical protein